MSSTIAEAGMRYPADLWMTVKRHFDAETSGTDAAKRIKAVDATCAMAQYRNMRQQATEIAAQITTD